jgi:hypothetical protein
MGTASDWMWVAFYDLFWGGGMLVWETLRKSDENIRPALSLADVLSWALLGLGFGIGTTFHWKAFHWPLVLFLVVAFVVGGVFARLGRRKLSHD